HSASSNRSGRSESTSAPAGISCRQPSTASCSAGDLRSGARSPARRHSDQPATRVISDVATQAVTSLSSHLNLIVPSWVVCPHVATVPVGEHKKSGGSCRLRSCCCLGRQGSESGIPRTEGGFPTVIEHLGPHL